MSPGYHSFAMALFFWLAISTVPPQAASGRHTQAGDVIPWLILLIGFILAGGVLIYFVKRWTKQDQASSAAGFTLQDLRELHARGELSEEEFQSARRAMIGRLAETSKRLNVQTSKDDVTGEEQGDAAPE